MVECFVFLRPLGLRLLGLAQALLGHPSLLFLDEPTTGLDPEAIREFYRILRELKADGVTMILTSHILAEIQERVDRLAIVKTGRIQALGTVQELREKMNLPLLFRVRLANPESGEVLHRALAGLAVEGWSSTGDEVSFHCHRQAKLASLQAVAALDGNLTDIHVQEPSLEDLFLGYAG